MLRPRIFLLSLLLGAPVFLYAQEAGGERRAVQAVRLEDDETIRLDGLLDEPAWQRISPATDFLQQEPHEGAAATERTEVRIAYDRHYLYLGVLLFDSQPEGILAHQRQRNASLATDDRFMWILDTFLDGRTAYFFEINPAGLMGDGLLRGTGTGQGGLNKSWDGIWEVRTANGTYGWSAEIRIPFRTLNFNPELDTWGINFQRTVRRKNEETLWSGHPRHQGLFHPTHAGRLTGLRGLSQGVGLEVKPFTTASWQHMPGTPILSSGFPADVGFDVNYNITPSLRASVTVNTDFAETEVDQRRVNLTRFPISFPEQRDFFLEGASVFSFAPANGINPYFSRRIGLVEGEQIPITYGARLTGQAGPYDLGFLQVRTGQLASHPAEDFTVARISRSLLSQSSLGLVYTRRATSEAHALGLVSDRHTVGSDLDLFTSRFAGNRNLLFQAFYVWHNDPVPGGSSSHWGRSARGVRLTYPNAPLNAHVSYREFGDYFDPAVGFVPRNGFRRLQPTVFFRPLLPSSSLIRRLEWMAFWEYLTNMDWEVQTISLDFTLLGIQFETGDEITADFSHSYELLGFNFHIYDGVVIPPGGYHFSQWELGAATAGRRRVSAGAAFSTGTFWSGNRTRYGGNLTLRPQPGFSISSDWQHNDVRLPEGAFTTNLLRLSSGWHFTTRMSLTGSLQYDDISRLMGLYSRFRWIVRPGSDLYLVYTHNWFQHADDNHFLTRSRGAATKVTYTYRF